MDLLIWSSTLGTFVYTVINARNTLKRADHTLGDTGTSLVGPLATLGQFGGLSFPGFVYWAATALNRFRQPEWMMEYALPSPPDVLGIDGMVFWRAIGLLVLLAGVSLTHSALIVAADELRLSGVSTPSFLVFFGTAHISFVM